MASPLADQITERIATLTSAVLERRRTRNTQRVQMTARRTAGLAKRHAAKLARATAQETTTPVSHHPNGQEDSE